MMEIVVHNQPEYSTHGSIGAYETRLGRNSKMDNRTPRNVPMKTHIVFQEHLKLCRDEAMYLMSL